MTRATRRSVVAGLGASLPFCLTGDWLTAPDGGSSNESDQGEEDAAELDVTVHAPGNVVEGGIETVRVVLSNPGSKSWSGQVTVTRGSQKTLFDNTATVPAGEEVSINVTWYVRNDAAGHAMNVTATAGSGTNSTLVSGISPFDVEIDGLEVNESDNTVTVTYTVSNTGTAPASHTVSVSHCSYDWSDTEVHLGIDQERTLKETLTVEPGKHNLEIATESTTVTEAFHV